LIAVRDTDSTSGASAVGEDENTREDPREQGTSGIADIAVSGWPLASSQCRLPLNSHGPKISESARWQAQ